MYDEDVHQSLISTIAKPADLRGILGDLESMACHAEQQAQCVGWLENQIGPGNNIGLRIRLMSCTNADQIKTFGKQHQRFEDTLPRDR